MYIMSRRIVVAFLISLLIIPVFLQGTRVNAKEHEHEELITSPLTSPITSPVSFFDLTGEVTYHQLGRLWGGMHRFFDAENVIVTVKNFFHPSQKYQTTTDADGMYFFDLTPGLYTVSVSDGKHTFFVPPFHVVTIHPNKTSHANLQGLLFPKFSL